MTAVVPDHRAAMALGYAQMRTGRTADGNLVADMASAYLSARLAVDDAVVTDPSTDEAPPAPKIPVTQTGDVWRLGPHTLICGDTLQLFGRGLIKTASMVFCDPPYGATANKWDACALPMEALWSALRRVGSKDAAYVFTAAQPFTTTVVDSNRKEFRYDLVWHKSRPVGFLHAKDQPLRAHESILIFGKFKTYTPQMTHGHKPYVIHNQTTTTNYSKLAGATSISNGERFPISVLTFASIYDKDAPHPTQKPVALLAWLMRTYTKPGDMVGDPTAGSGTTLIACQHTNRICHTVEQDPAYCDVIVERWQNLTGQKATRT